MLFLLVIVSIPLFFIFILPHIIMAITNREVPNNNIKALSWSKFGIMIVSLILSYLAIAGSILIVTMMWTDHSQVTLQMGIGSILSWISFLVIGKRWCYNLKSSRSWLLIAGLSPVITLIHPEHIEIAIFGLVAFPVLLLNYFIIFYQVYTTKRVTETVPVGS